MSPSTPTPADAWLVCPLCGFEFQKSDALCEHGCPMATMCSLSRCPSCGYEFPAPAKSVSWFRRLFRNRAERAVNRSPAMRTLRNLAPGERAEVAAVVNESAGRNTLATFGLIPGAAVTVVQHLPSCVVRVGETEIALDPEIAEQILLRPAGEAA